MTRRLQIWIDRGGTFTDCIAFDPSSAELKIEKVLSSDRAPLIGIRRLHGLADDAPIPPCDIRMGTTLATNALLERRGTPSALIISRGFADLLRIGDQTRPELFALNIRRPEPLYTAVRELPGRASAAGELLERATEAEARAVLRELRALGLDSLAVAFLHAHLNGALEAELGQWAREEGFTHVSLSHQVVAEQGLTARGDTTTVDAYLTPLLHRYVQTLLAELPGSSLRIMQSSGALTDARQFRGRNAVLSGPAGGVVALAELARRRGLSELIGFDMGGTSTDVCRYAGGLDHVYETQLAGVRLRAPMLRIHTVAAGGGSICRFDGQRLRVGPHSAGAEPGPLCYGQPGATELTLTDVNLALGRLRDDRFPFPLRREPVDAALARLSEALGQAGMPHGPMALAEGFFSVAVEHMAAAIARVSIARGHDVRSHALVVFGGAGGQHACAVARRLGIRRVLLHPQAGVLSAYGMGVAEVGVHGEADAGRVALTDCWPEDLEARFVELERAGRAALAAQGFAADAVRTERRVDLRYRGTESSLTLRAEGCDTLDIEFMAEHRASYGYARPGHPVEVVTLRVAALAAGHTPALGALPPPEPCVTEVLAPLWLDGAFRQVPVWRREQLRPGEALQGPALVLEATGTLVVEPDFVLTLDSDGVLVLDDTFTDRVSAANPAVGWDPDGSAGRAGRARALPGVSEANEKDPVLLEVFNHRFMAIAEQMGSVLQRTALSTNIRERLDFSCALFDGQGQLIANAPHIPVHLGAMGESVRAVVALHPQMRPGDVYATNDPALGGSHIPDVTVITPVFASLTPGRSRDLPAPPAEPSGAHPSAVFGDSARPLFFVANRGHHADIGGITPGSMPPFSRSIDDEGVRLSGLCIVRDGRLDEALLRALLTAGPHPARDPDQNLADLEAQVAANRAGQRLLEELCAHHSLELVQAYMGHVQDNAAASVAAAIARLPEGDHAFADTLDDGTRIAVRIRIAGEHMHLDFSGSSPQVDTNLNAPRAVTLACVLYVLRALCREPIPLNAGCLRNVTLTIPEPSVLAPSAGAAVVAGNVETSQRIVDVLLAALGQQAASQGTMNNLTFGDASFGYYETIAGGAGAGPDFDGASGVHTHMTNTRITDPELLEARFPVRLWRFSLRPGSGGAGRRRGGDGVVRELEALVPLTVSMLSERRVTRPFGLDGGEPGAPGRNFHGPREVLGRAQFTVQPGERFGMHTPGGGGFGTPEQF